jgi:hypothetical protein
MSESSQPPSHLGFLDPVTVSKIHVLGSGYQKELLSQVPAENLPVEKPHGALIK